MICEREIRIAAHENTATTTSKRVRECGYRREIARPAADPTADPSRGARFPAARHLSGQPVRPGVQRRL